MALVRSIVRWLFDVLFFSLKNNKGSDRKTGICEAMIFMKS